MSATVTIKQYQQIIKFAVKSKENGVNLPVFAWGNHGVGKTSIIRSFAKENGFKAVVLNLANQTPEELMGAPDGKGGYYKPDWFVSDSKVRVLYFLDEINRAPKYVLQSIFNFINEGRINSHQINDGDVVIAAGNPGSMNYDVTDFDDKAFLSRFAHIYVEPTVDEFIKYVNRNKKSNGIIAEMLKESPDMCDNTVKGQDRVEVRPDNRMLEKCDLITGFITETEFKDFGFEIISSMIGEDNASIFINKWTKKNDVPNPADILSGKIPLKSIDIERIDMITVLNTKLVKYMIDQNYFEDNKYPKKEQKIACEYFQYIPKDHAYGLIKELRLNEVNQYSIVDFFEPAGEFLYDIMEMSG